MKAAELARAGYAPYVLVDGPQTLVAHESDATIQYAVYKGYPAKLFHPLWLPDGVSSTRTEAVYVGEFLRDHNIRSILLVTSNYHTHRAGYLMRKENPWLSVTVVAAPDRFFSVDGWWKTREGQKTFLIEWLKTVATWLGV